MKISPTSVGAGGVALLLAGAALFPALGQEHPESLLPPGFDSPAPSPTPRPSQTGPAQLLPPTGSNPPASVAGAPAVAPLPSSDEALGNETAAELPPVDLSKYELPDSAKRSLAAVGPSSPASGGLAQNALGHADGRYLETLMRRLDAPIASRWMSIALRRMLLSKLDTPAQVNGADFAAERAWLLLRMGESVAARYLVQSVDIDNYTPKMFQVAMQASLATADPAGLCPLVERGSALDPARGWTLAQAMCAGLAGDPNAAGQQIDAARHQGVAGGVDLLLAEKIAGMGAEGRRAVTIEWAGVDRLTTWRFGLASASGADIPEPLYGTLRPQVRYWRALLPGPDPVTRASAAELAAAQGVFSSSALVDLYGEIADTGDNSAEAGTARDLRSAFADSDAQDRLTAMRGLWNGANGARARYGRLILTARAATGIPAEAAYSSDADALVASMLSAGLEQPAERWSAVAPRGSDAWAMLALASRSPTLVRYGDADSYRGRADAHKAQMLIAGLAGLGRLSLDDARGLARAARFDLDTQNPWTWAIDAAAQRHETGSVVLLAAVGMQTPVWQGVPPEMLYHICRDLRAVGLDGYARMIAAEAIARL